jgi:hypothetical protein
MNKNIITIAIALVALVVGAGIGYGASNGGSSAAQQTVTKTTTLGASVSTTTVISTVTSLREGAALVTYSGSGDGSSSAFTATTSSVYIKTQVTTSDPSLSLVSWYIYPVGSAVYAANGDVNGQSGSFNFTGYGLTVGSDYYVMVISANANWQITVTGLS